MAFSIPDSMDGCVYFTNRSLLNADGKPTGRIVCWVPREHCPKCKKGLMGKPWDEKEKKFRVRATEYVCPSCKHVEQKKEYEAMLTAYAQYTCPACQKKGEGKVPFTRKTYMGVKAIVFTCEHCAASIPVTKKLKEVKKKKGKVAVVAADDDDDF